MLKIVKNENHIAFNYIFAKKFKKYVFFLTSNSKNTIFAENLKTWFMKYESKKSKCHY